MLGLIRLRALSTVPGVEAGRDATPVRLAAVPTMLLAALAIGLSSFRIVIAPGFEMYLGPIFYLIAYRYGGLRVGLPIAVAVMAPSLFWWGHVYSILIAVAHVLFLHWLRARRWSFSILTLVFQMTVGVVATALIMSFHYEAPLAIAALTYVRKLLNDLLLAALVDLGIALIWLDPATRRISFRTSVRLSRLMESATILIVIGSALAMFLGDVRDFPRIFTDFQRDIGQNVELSILQAERRGRTFLGPQMIDTGETSPQELVLATSPAALTADAVTQRLGCARIDDGGKVTGPNDRNTFAYWMSACQLKRTAVSGQPIYYVYSTAPIAEAAYYHVLAEMIGPALILALAIALQTFAGRAMAGSIHAWRDVVGAFGSPDIVAPTGLMFTEFKWPIATFVDTNNRYASLIQERGRLVDAVEELKRGIDLRLVSDVRFDPIEGGLRFTEVSIDRPAEATLLRVHPNDWLAFANAQTEREAFIEFRLGSGERDDWYLLLARAPTAPGRWQSGCILRLRQAQIAQDRMLQKARLIELGGMASAISHEIKQPLFTIALAAENGAFLLDSPETSPAQVRVKFERIMEQVDRARAIIGRISHYARIDSGDGEPFDLAEGVKAATTFMRPLLVQEDVRIDVIVDTAEPLVVRLPRVGLEQIIVNAIQNAVDAIVTRRAAEPEGMPGKIEIRIGSTEDGLAIRLTDNGTGLTIDGAETAFEAFMTTKSGDKGTGLGLYISRQIMMEIGGTIAIESRPAPEHGAVVTLALPASARAGEAAASA